MAIILDTEYTTWPGALETGWAAPGQHREIVQIAAIRVDDGFNEIGAFEAIVRPSVNPDLSDLFIGLTGVTQERVDAEGVPFPAALASLHAFTGDDPVICMNGDCKVFLDNCDINRVCYPFARQFHRLRPLLERSGVDLTRCSSGDLHMLTLNPLEGRAHDALHDVRSMAAWLRHAVAMGTYTGLSQMPTDLPTRDPRSSALDEKALEAGMRVLQAAGVTRGWFRRNASVDLDVVVKAIMSAVRNPQD